MDKFKLHIPKSLNEEPLLPSRKTKPILHEAIKLTGLNVTPIGGGQSIMSSNGKERRAIFLKLCHKKLKEMGCKFTPPPQDLELEQAFRDNAILIFGQEIPQ